LNTYTTVSHQGYFGRLKNSFIGVLVGLLFFAGSFFLLWKNEGNYAREKGALKEIARTAVEGSVDAPSTDTVGKCVHLVGELLSEEQVGDPGYILPGDYLKIRRKVEMYQWVEQEKSETREKLGGGSETVTTYTYDRRWRSGRVDSGSFKNIAGHENPEPTVSDAEFSVAEASFGAWNGMDVLDYLTPDEALAFTGEMIDPELAAGQPDGDYIYIRRNPGNTVDTIGDQRLSWQVLYPGTYSVMARHDLDNRLAPIVASNGKEKFLVGVGTLSIPQMIEMEKSSQSLFAWIFRLLGFLLMWMGLSLTLGPLATMLSIIPVAATAGRFAIGGITFVVALGLTVATVVVSWIAHSPVVLGILVAGGLAAAFAWMKKRSSAPVSAHPVA